MKKTRILLTFLVCILLQLQLARKLPFLRAVPLQLLLIATVYYALQRDWFGGMLVGIAAGFLLDIFSDGQLGVFALSYGVVGMMIGMTQSMIFKEDLLPRLLLVFAATLLLQVLNYSIIRNYQPNMALSTSLYRSILPGALLNCAAALILFLVSGKIGARKAWSRGRRRV
jgi:rod shape-determining protein MreD